MQLIDGKALAAKIQEDIKLELAKSELQPKLAVLLVGDDPASHLYVSLKEKVAQEAGIATDIRRLPALTPDSELIRIIEEWNRDSSVDAILVQVPLPPGHDTDKIIGTMDPKKDVDGFHPENIRALAEGEPNIIPPVHEGILRLIAQTDVSPNHTEAVVFANSETFSAPLVRLLRSAGAFAQAFKPESFDEQAVQLAKIIVVAVGHPKFLTRDLISSGAVVIDVGTNRLPDGKTVGDVDAENVKDIPGWLSPVPGGVGPMTIAMILKNVVNLASRK